MDLAFSDLVAPITDLADTDALQCWRWLAGAEAKPLLLTSLGDLFVTLREGSVAFLDTYEGTLRTVSVDRAAWKLALQDEENLHAWFTPGLVLALRERGLRLSAGQCYSPIHPPVMGGTMEHEVTGELLLLEHGVEARVARICRTHADWRQEGAALEELLVALADKLWKGKRVPELEERVLAVLVERSGRAHWDLFVPFDDLCERVAAQGPHRLERSRVAG